MSDTREPAIMLNEQHGVRGELLWALALFAVAGAGIWLSLEMDRPKDWATAPGIVPLFLSVGLAGMSATIACGAIRRGALRSIWFRALSARERAIGFSFAGASLLIALFFFVFLNFLPFEIACSLYLYLMFQMFWREGRWWQQMLTAVLLSLLFVFCFHTVFDLPLPGTNNLLEGLKLNLRLH